MIQLLRLIRAATGSDRDLLGRFVRDGDEEAFAALVQRYGSGVWAACVRLANRDAEDAFQAVFLTLARKAGSVSGSLPAWLHSVTRRVAANLRRSARRRTAAEAGAARTAGAVPADPSLREGLALLDEELARLPERYRTVLIVCCLEGRSRDEAAAQLGWSEGQVKGRLERARAMLRTRLARRGIELGGVLLAASITRPAPAAPAAPSPAVVSLTNGVIRAMAIQKLKVAAAVLAVCVGVGVLLARGPSAEEKAEPPTKAAAPAEPPPKHEIPAGTVTPLKPAPTVQELSTVLGITWWEFDLPKTARAVELGILEDGQFTQIERYDLQPRFDVPGVLKIAYQDGAPEFRLTVLTKGGTLRTKGDKPADFMRVHGMAVKNGEYLELAGFKHPKDKGWKYALVIKVVEKAD